MGVSCTAQSLPSGSLKKKQQQQNEFHGLPGPSTQTPSSMCWTALTSTPRYRRPRSSGPASRPTSPVTRSWTPSSPASSPCPLTRRQGRLRPRPICPAV